MKNIDLPSNDLLRCTTDTKATTHELLKDWINYRDPLANNPRMTIEHRFTLIRPQELMAAHFIWLGICRTHNISKAQSDLLRYTGRIIYDYTIIEAHTHLHEPLFEREKQ